jgi:polygalacturonase
MITPFTHPRSCEFAHEIDLTVNGISIEVLRTDAADFANLIFDPADGPAKVSVVYTDGRQVAEAVIRPANRNLTADLVPTGFSFQLADPDKLSLEVPGRRPLFFWANPPETDRPDPDDPDVLWLKAGQIVEAAEFELKSNQTLYLEGGAVLRGALRASEAENITVCGHGILDGSYYRRDQGEFEHLARFHRCRNVTVRDITMIHPSGWMLVPAACEEVTIENLKQIGEVVSSDGIDVVGCRNVTIRDCFLNNNDDCVSIKAFVVGPNNGNRIPCDGRENVENLLIEHCTLVNAPAGTAMEIGHELNVESVRNIVFRDIDVLSIHGQGAAFSIHNFGQALVENIRYEDIRIEHCWDKFIDFRISRSRFSVGDITGRIRNITLKNINWLRADVNPGYTVSMMGGWSPEADISGIHLDNVCINGEPITSLDELEVTTRYTTELEVVSGT